MGFKRQLTSSEIFEQAYRFAQELAAKGERLSNVVGVHYTVPTTKSRDVTILLRIFQTLKIRVEYTNRARVLDVNQRLPQAGVCIRMENNFSMARRR